MSLGYLEREQSLEFSIFQWILSLNHINYSNCIEIWIRPVLFSPYRDLKLIHQVLNSPTIQFGYIILFAEFN